MNCDVYCCILSCFEMNLRMVFYASGVCDIMQVVVLLYVVLCM